ncbi:MAG TPA: glycosyltransferase family 39 protein, partial [Solirubrobacterales bacterium]|nr:glycosyltransferase family 39 protein [Solirubrobacterales bacterium]
MKRVGSIPPSTLAVAAVVLLALVVRLGAIAVDDGYSPQHDSLDYDRHARSIAERGSYPEAIRVVAPDGGPTAFRPPGYPVFLATVYEATGNSATAGRIANALLGALAVLLTYHVARELLSRRVALVAAAFAAFYPPLVSLSLELYSEPLFLVLMLGSVLAALRFRPDPRLGMAALAGLLTGGTMLARPNGVILIPFIAWALWRPPGRSGRSLAAPAIAVLIAALALTPWIARNEIVLDRFVPLSTGAGFNLAGVYNDEARDDERFEAAWRLPIRIETYDDIYAVPDQREIDLDDRLRERGLDYAQEHPGYVAEVVFWSALRSLNLADAGTASASGLVSERGIGTEITRAEPAGFFIAAAL